jgi:hypothetical protein
MSEMSNPEPLSAEVTIQAPDDGVESPVDSVEMAVDPVETPADTVEPADPVETPADTVEPALDPVETAAEVPAPAGPAPRLAVPSPAVLASRHGAPSARSFGRVDDDGVVYVRTAEGERAVGSYPGATPQDAIGYFVRKFDELVASADLLLQRIRHTDMPAKDAAEAHAKLVEHTSEPNVVGDLAALEAKVAEIGDLIEDRRGVESAAKAAAREAAKGRRAALVDEAEQIAAQDPERTQWKSSGARMRELLDEWKSEQRTGARLDKESESALWHRFSAARNSFDKARRTYFSQLDAAQGDAKRLKEKLVDEAEHLAKSTDWAATAGAFKSLMSRWREAGRASRHDDDALWERFKAAQDAFFAAKDAIVAAEDEEFRSNLAVKEGLLAEAEGCCRSPTWRRPRRHCGGSRTGGKPPARCRVPISTAPRSALRASSRPSARPSKPVAVHQPGGRGAGALMVDQLEASVASLTRLTAARSGATPRPLPRRRRPCARSSSGWTRRVPGWTSSAADGPSGRIARWLPQSASGPLGHRRCGRRRRRRRPRARRRMTWSRCAGSPISKVNRRLATRCARCARSPTGCSPGVGEDSA